MSIGGVPFQAKCVQAMDEFVSGKDGSTLKVATLMPGKVTFLHIIKVSHMSLTLK